MEAAVDGELIARINERTSSLAQGDVLDVGAVTWLAVGRAPLTPQSATAQSDGLTCVITESDQLAIITQTCDIRRDAGVRPFLLLARVVTLDEPIAGEARAGHRPRYVPLMELDANAFVDMDVVVTVEKSALLDVEATPGLAGDAARRRFGIAVGRVHSRFAFPDDLAVALQGVVTRIRQKHAKGSPEGQALSTLEAIRVTASPSWTAAEIAVFISFCPATRASANSVLTDDEWDQLVDGWLRQAEPTGAIASVDGAMIPLEELTALEYVESDPLDLDHLSWSRA